MFSRSKMWRRSVAWLAATFVGVAASMDMRILSQNQFSSSPQINCVDYPKLSMDVRAGRFFNQGWKLPRLHASSLAIPFTMSAQPFVSYLNTNEIVRRSVNLPAPAQVNQIARRYDRLLPDTDDIVKEHAKLVQDINSLRQAVFIASFPEDSRDYEDSIFHEIIDTSTTPRTTTTRAPARPTRASSFPVLLLGGASQKQLIKMPTLKMPKPTISLVGTSVSSLVKHPYPFASATAALPARKPMKICVTSMPSFFPTTRRPSLWERIINSIIPR